MVVEIAVVAMLLQLFMVLMIVLKYGRFAVTETTLLPRLGMEELL